MKPRKPPLVSVEEAASLIVKGGLVAAPSDTVCGLLADATNSKAVERLFEAKGRQGSKAISVFVEGPREIERLCEVSPDAKDFMNTLLPGPYTLVLPVRGEEETALAPALHPHGTLGVRLIDHPVVVEILRLVKRPLTATSANPSGMSPATSVEELSPYLLERIDGVIDGGRTLGGASTVLSFAEDPPVVLREGRGMEAFRRWYERRF